MDQSLVNTFSWGNSYGPMVLKVLPKFAPTLGLVHGWLFPDSMNALRHDSSNDDDEDGKKNCNFKSQNNYSKDPDVLKIPRRRKLTTRSKLTTAH